jgi:hypothetical protein
MITGGGGFVLHTFMAEKTTVRNYLCKSSLPGSDDFRGQGGTYLSANFQRIGVKDYQVFSGKVVTDLDYIDESGLGFNY